MTQWPSDPIPPEGSPTAPTTAVALTAPLPPPLPVIALPYSPPRQGRPGLITAIGVLSIVLASLSFLVNLMTFGQGVMVLLVANISTTMPGGFPGPMMPPPTTTVATTAQQGLTDAERLLAANHLGRLQALSRARKKQLNLWLSSSGKSALDAGDEGVTATGLERAVAGHGKDISYPTGEAPDYFNFNSGRLLVFNDRSIFKGNDGTEQTLSADTTTGGSSSVAVATRTPIPRGPGLTPKQRQQMGRAATAAGAVMIEAAADFALSIYLLIIGILMLRGTGYGRRLHRIYAWIKIAFALAGLATWVAIRSLIADVNGSQVQILMRVVSVVAVALIGCGCIYPVALLLALRSRTVSDYYASTSS